MESEENELIEMLPEFDLGISVIVSPNKFQRED